MPDENRTSQTPARETNIASEDMSIAPDDTKAYNDFKPGFERKIKRVNILITNQNDCGEAIVRSYPINDYKNYTVPLYRAYFRNEDFCETDDSYFEVIRFGVLYKEDKNKNLIGPSVVGLSKEQSYTLKWCYSPTLSGMAWLVKEELQGEESKRWFIHKGANNPSETPFGAIGCVEVTGEGEWDRFLKIIKKLSLENDFYKISEAGTLTATYEAVIKRPALREKQ